MKHTSHNLDERINTFIARKMEQFPELDEQSRPKVKVRQRIQFLADTSDAINLKSAHGAR